MASQGINFIFENKLKIGKICKINECIRDIIIELLNKYHIVYDEIYFYYKGIKCKDDIVAEYFFKKSGEINIFVYLLRKSCENNIKNLITCPKCGNFCIIKFDGFRINLKDCEKKHLITDLSLEEYNLYSSKNKQIPLNTNPFLCFVHQGKYCSFCKTCKQNLCTDCEEEHANLNHTIKQFHNILRPDMKEYLKEKNTKMNLLKKGTNSLKKDINEIIGKFENIKKNLDIYYKINENILNAYVNQKYNYYILKNIYKNDFENSIGKIQEIIEENNLVKKCEKLFNLYDDINDVHQIKIKYNINKSSFTKAFGDDFVFNNKDKCKVILKGGKTNLKTNYLLSEDSSEIILTNIDKVTDMSCMFKDCVDLYSCSDISKWNTKSVTNMSKLFYFCESLIEIPNISNWNISNVKNLSDFMTGCKCISIPDFSKWDTSSVEDMSYMFSNCINIPSLAGIENWDTSNVKNLSHIFENCSSLKNIPDIGKWNTAKVIDFSYMFSGCKILEKLPDNISKWDTNNAERLGYVFNGCARLESSNINEIIKFWKFEKVKDKKYIFKGCPQNIIDEIYLGKLNLENCNSSGDLEENNGCKIF